MKMGMIFSGVFWGIFLILIGVSVLIKVFFHIDLPIVRIFFGLFFIVLGLQIILGRNQLAKYTGWTDEGNVVFGEGQLSSPDPYGKYNIVFGKGTTDLSNVELGESGAKLEVNTIFSDNTIFIKKGMAVSIKANAAFSQTDLPDGNTTAFGTYYFKSPEFKEGAPAAKIELNTVFGASHVRYKE